MKRDHVELEKELNKIFQKKGYPGMAVSIRGPEGILFEKGFGIRNGDSKLPVDQDTVFGIASMSKSMTALALCILQTEGKLDLKDPIVKYFPDMHIPGAPDECVTLEIIAMHRAGIPPMPPLEWSIAMNSIERDSKWYRHMVATAPNKMDKIEDIVEYISKGDYKTLGAPGEYMSYSNDGYALLSYVADQAAGISLEQFLDEKVFKPLGMTRTVLDLDCSRAREMAGGNITSLFERNDDGSLIWDDNWSVLPPFRGCACVKSTAADMGKHYKALSDGGMYEGKQAIPAEAVELLIGRTFPTRKKPFYCLGLEKFLIEGKAVCQHSGGLHGVSSMGGLIEGGYSAVVLCNEGDAAVEEVQWMCYNYILGLPLATTHYWAAPNGKEFSMPEALCGDFLCNEGLPVHTVVRYENGKLSADYGDTKVDLLFCGERYFAAVAQDDHNKRISTFRFYIRDGKAWAVKCYNRIYQRVDQL